MTIITITDSVYILIQNVLKVKAVLFGFHHATRSVKNYYYYLTL